MYGSFRGALSGDHIEGHASLDRYHAYWVSGATFLDVIVWRAETS
jgi:hypothetical protein